MPRGKNKEPRKIPETTFTKRVGGQGERAAFKSPHSPNRESQKEERDSVIDAVKQNYWGPDRKPLGQGE